MNFRVISLGMALGLAAAVVPTSASAQAQPAQAERKFSFSKGALKPLQELDAAVKANDRAAIPAKLAAAKAAAQTSDDRLMTAQLELKAAAAVDDKAAMAAALDAMIANSGLAATQTVEMQMNLAKLRFNLKEHDKAAAAAEQVLAVQPGHTDALLLLAETRKAQGRAADAVAALQRAILARTSAGQKAEESWYKRAIAFAYEAKMPAAVTLGREWVAAYPSAQSWGDALRIYRNVVKPDEPTLLDTLRLARATNSLSGDNEFHGYAYTALDAYALHEAKSVIDEGVAANKIDRSKPLIKEIDAAIASKMTNVSREGLAASAKEALTDANGRFALRIADAHYGLGEYAKAAELYRAALGKAGADANLVNLRLGMALARAGDKAGATAAFNAVTGPRAELAKFWLLYLTTSA